MSAIENLIAEAEFKKGIGKLDRVPVQGRLGLDELKLVKAYMDKYNTTMPEALRLMVAGWNEVLKE